MPITPSVAMNGGSRTRDDERGGDQSRRQPDEDARRHAWAQRDQPASTKR